MAPREALDQAFEPELAQGMDHLGGCMRAVKERFDGQALLLHAEYADVKPVAAPRPSSSQEHSSSDLQAVLS